MKNEGVRHQIIDMMREAGFDFMTAAEETAILLDDFLNSAETERRIHIKFGPSFTLKRN